MKTTTPLSVLAFTLALTALLPATATAQLGGSLTPPPGVPAPGMKTLDQVEARTPLVAGAPGVIVTGNGSIAISAPGSYYLTRNLEVPSGNGITINADGVTLDLNGFRLSSTSNPSTGTGIYCSVGTGSITIRNGHIFGAGTLSGATPAFSGAGFSLGINAYTSNQVLVSNVQVCGTSDNAILTDVSKSTVVENCTVQHCGGNGIRAATIRGCTAISTLNVGLSGETVTQSKGSSLRSHGITGIVVSDCTGHTDAPSSISASGIFADVVSNSRGSYSLSGSPRSITATIATSCRAGGTANITNKYNMP